MVAGEVIYTDEGGVEGDGVGKLGVAGVFEAAGVCCCGVGGWVGRVMLGFLEPRVDVKGKDDGVEWIQDCFESMENSGTEG